MEGRSRKAVVVIMNRLRRNPDCLAARLILQLCEEAEDSVFAMAGLKRRMRAALAAGVGGLHGQGQG